MFISLFSEGNCPHAGKVFARTVSHRGEAVSFCQSYEDRGSRWYAAYTRHQHEKVVAALLTAKGVEVFLPLYTERSRWADRTKILQRPLFPCYVFAHTDLTRRVAILQTPSVYSLVGGSTGPTPIPEYEIAAIRSALAGPLLVEPYPFLSIGDLVRVKAGPLAGIEGILVRKKSTQRLILSVEMLQKSVAVDVDGCLVERVHRGSPLKAPAVRGVELRRE